MSMNQDLSEELDVAQRSSKRAKVTDDEDAAAWLTLPPDAWANVMEYLPLADVMSLSSTSKFIHDDATPLVKTLHIMKASEMNPKLAKKFRNVRDMFIYSLGSYQRFIVEDEDGEDEAIMGRDRYVIDFETSVRAAPFLSNNFIKLERVFFGSTLLDGQLLPFFNINRIDMDRYNWIANRNSIQTMSALIDSLSAAFRCGALSPDLVIRGLRCLQNLEEEVEECPCCHRAARSWPIKSVAMFECEGSSYDQTASMRSYDLDVCISRHDLERIIKKRPGGHELLHSKFRLLHLLERGQRVIDDSNGLMCMACYSEDQLNEIKRVFKCAKIRASDLDPRELTQCMMKSLHSEMLHPTPSSFTSCLLSVYARDKLNTDLGLIFEEDDAVQFRCMALGCLKFLVNGIDDSSYGNEIEKECLSFLHGLVSIQNPPLRAIVDSKAVIHMLTILEERRDGSFSKLKSAQVVAKLLLEGSRNGHGSGYNDVTSLCNFLLDHESREIDSKTATFLVGSIRSVGIESAAVMVLADLMKKLDVRAETHDRHTMSALVDAGLITNTIHFLNQSCSNRDGVTDAVDILIGIAVVSEELLWTVLDAGVMDTIASSVDENKVIWDEWENFLFQTITDYDYDKRFLKKIMEHVRIDCLVNTMNSRPDGAAVDVLSAIIAELKDDLIITAAVESGIIAAIESAMFSRSSPLLSIEHSLVALSTIARHSAAYQDAVYKSGVLDRVGSKLIDKMSLYGVPFLSLLHAMSLHGRSKHLVGKIIELDLAPFLATMTARVRGKKLSFAVETLVKVINKDISAINGIVEAGLISNLAESLNREQSSTQRANITQNASVLLQQISGYSACYRDEVLKSGIFDLLTNLNVQL